MHELVLRHRLADLGELAPHAVQGVAHRDR
jgi:hypothetical protein